MLEQKTVAEFMQGDSGDFVIFDVRDRASYHKGHIKGAVSMPVDEIDESCLVGIDRLAVLCGGGTKAVRAIERIVALGFVGQIVHLTDGTRGAVAAGIELES